MGDDTTYKIDLEDSINVDIGQLNLDLNDTITYNVASPGGGSSGATYGDGRFDPLYGVNDTGSEYTININPGQTLYTETNFKNDVEEMSKDYPGLDKAWRNFKLFYDICKSDFDKKKENDAQ
tara:strand:+ start:613 stop:978 length:366 start_codon:yes stop_codon:yes gene_type:complete